MFVGQINNFALDSRGLLHYYTCGHEMLVSGTIHSKEKAGAFRVRWSQNLNVEISSPKAGAIAIAEDKVFGANT